MGLRAIFDKKILLFPALAALVIAQHMGLFLEQHYREDDFCANRVMSYMSIYKGDPLLERAHSDLEGKKGELGVSKHWRFESRFLAAGVYPLQNWLVQLFERLPVRVTANQSTYLTSLTLRMAALLVCVWAWSVAGLPLLLLPLAFLIGVLGRFLPGFEQISLLFYGGQSAPLIVVPRASCVFFLIAPLPLLFDWKNFRKDLRKKLAIVAACWIFAALSHVATFLFMLAPVAAWWCVERFWTFPVLAKKLWYAGLALLSLGAALLTAKLFQQFMARSGIAEVLSNQGYFVHQLFLLCAVLAFWLVIRLWRKGDERILLWGDSLAGILLLSATLSAGLWKIYPVIPEGQLGGIFHIIIEIANRSRLFPQFVWACLLSVGVFAAVPPRIRWGIAPAFLMAAAVFGWLYVGGGLGRDSLQRALGGNPLNEVRLTPYLDRGGLAPYADESTYFCGLANELQEKYHPVR